MSSAPRRGLTVLDHPLIRHKLALRGSQSATLVLTRIAGERVALLCERPVPPGAE